MIQPYYKYILHNYKAGIAVFKILLKAPHNIARVLYLYIQNNKCVKATEKKVLATVHGTTFYC